MKNSVHQSAASLGAIAVMMAVSAPAFAQTPAPADTASNDGLNEIVVTASGQDRSRLQSAVAVTSVDAATIANFKPLSESEIYRLIPGIQAAGTAGPVVSSLSRSKGWAIRVRSRT